MAKYEFWGQIGLGRDSNRFYEIVDIPDERIKDLSPEEREKFLLSRHRAWIEHRSFGGWERISEK